MSMKLQELNEFQNPKYLNWSPLPGIIPFPDIPKIQFPQCPLIPVPNICGTKKCVVPAQQPVVPVPVYHEIRQRDRVIEIPQTILSNEIIPKVYKQEVVYDVPQLKVLCKSKTVRVPRVEFREKIIEVPIAVGYKYKTFSTWEYRDVPKVVPKFVGEQQTIEVEVPQVQIVDKTVEKTVPIYIGEKEIKKEVIEEIPVDVVEYKYVEKEQEVPVYKYKQVFDVEVDIPPPLIVPVPVEPKKVQLEPERISLEDWRKLRLGGASSCCNEYEFYNSRSDQDNCKVCSSCCRPGGVFTRGGFCSCKLPCQSTQTFGQFSEEKELDIRSF